MSQRARARRAVVGTLAVSVAWAVVSALAPVQRAIGAEAPDTAWIEAKVDRTSPPSADLPRTIDGALLDANGQAAILAAELLLTPLSACQSDQCQDTDGLCKRCAQPVTAGVEPSATDALAILRVAVGQTQCATCVCDADGNGTVAATDALLTLKRAVGQSVALDCPTAA